MFKRASLFILSGFFIAAMVFGLAFFPVSAGAMEEMNGKAMSDKEMSRVTVGEHRMIAMRVPQKTRLLRDAGKKLQKLSDSSLCAITASGPVKVMMDELQGEVWHRGCQEIEYPLLPREWTEKSEAELALLRNWRLMGHFKVDRQYFNVGMENYGWELHYEAPGDRYYEELHHKMAWIDGRPLAVEAVQFIAKRFPEGESYVSEKKMGTLYRDRECFYHQGYFIFLEY